MAKSGNAQNRRTIRKPKRKRNTGKIMLWLFLDIIVILVLILVIGWDKGVSSWMVELNRPVVKEVDVTGINSLTACLLQARSGKVVGEMNGETIIYPASMTKMMTAIVAIENLKSLDTKITVPSEIFPDLYAQDAMRAGFEPGEEVEALDLLYGVMLPSGAECCLALADYISDSEEAFVDLMNQKAYKIGMDTTHFCDTTGLHDPQHYSTAHDMAVLLKYCLKNKTFRQIVESSWHATKPTSLHPDGITFYSTVFKNLPDPYVTNGRILGGKTGYTSDAGYCLASFAEIGGREYILVTVGAGENQQHIEDAKTIFERVGQKLNE